MADEYSRFADMYDRLLNPFLSHIRNKTTEMIRAENIHAILDMGCGTGEQVEQLKQAGVNAFGVDLSAAMLGQALKKNRANPTCCRADASITPFGNHAFDACLFSFALHEKTSRMRQSILNEALRVTREDGWFITVDFNPSPVSSVAQRLTLGGIHWVERMAGRDHYRCYRSFMDQDGLNGLHRNFPLTLVRAVPILRGNGAIMFFRKTG
ncbi:MAG: SAM-dependent methyltransferase [Desulfobacteraceae bacterium]|nr:MAG: SAM-dependent methyltransferase [Desulfobacteraceae bacterium]